MRGPYVHSFTILYTLVCVCMASTRLAPRLLYVWSALHWSCAVATLRSPPPTRSRADKKKKSRTSQKRAEPKPVSRTDA